MKVCKRRVIDDLHALFCVVRKETDDKRKALIAAVRMFSVTHDGRAHHRPVRPILQAVCGHFGIDLTELVQKSRSPTRVRARQIAAWLLTMSNYSLREAAEAMGCTHGNIRHAVEQVEHSEALMAEAAAVATLMRYQLGEPDGRLPVIFPKEGIR